MYMNVHEIFSQISFHSVSSGYMSSYLYIQDEKPFHASAVCAAAIHSITVPFRLQRTGPSSDLAHSSGNLDIGELLHILSDQGRQNMVTALDVAMPAPSLTGTQHNICPTVIPTLDGNLILLANCTLVICR